MGISNLEDGPDGQESWEFFYIDNPPHLGDSGTACWACGANWEAMPDGSHEMTHANDCVYFNYPDQFGEEI